MERVQSKFLSFPVWILKTNHLPHDYEPVLNNLLFSSLVDRRIQVSFIKKAY